jgi:uncharacterized cupredoxin-like copper-binding protein
MAAVVGLAVLLGACGGGKTATDDDIGAGAASYGQPGDPAKATRTIAIMTLDSLRYDPASIDVRPGETVTFKVTNMSKVAHEFDIGDAAFQAKHETEMRAMPAGMVMSDETGAIDLQPGETKMLTWTFAKAGGVLYACHQPGHYAAGMKGDIKVG